MGTVAAALKVMPSADADLNALKKSIEELVSKETDVKLQGIEEKPIAFGLRALQVLLVMPDTHGTDKIEKAISALSNVESVETGDVTLL